MPDILSALRTITNVAEKEYTYLGKCISKILFIDTEELSKI